VLIISSILRFDKLEFSDRVGDALCLLTRSRCQQ